MAWPSDDPNTPPVLGAYNPAPVGSYEPTYPTSYPLYVNQPPARQPTEAVPNLVPGGAISPTSQLDPSLYGGGVPAPAAAVAPAFAPLPAGAGGSEPAPAAQPGGIRQLPPGLPPEGVPWSLIKLTEEEQAPRRLSGAEEIGRGLVRGVATPLMQLDMLGNRAIAWAEGKLGVDFVKSQAEERVAGWKNYMEQFKQEWAPQEGTLVDAYRNAGVSGAFNHFLGAASEMLPSAIPVLRAAKWSTAAVYGGVLGGLQASEQSDGDPAATAAGIMLGAATFGGQQKILFSKLSKDAVTDLAAKIGAAELAAKIGAAGGIGAAATAAHPLVDVAGGKEYQVPSWEQFVEGTALGAATYGLPAAAHAYLGRGRAPAAPEPPPAVDPAAAQALTLALPAPAMPMGQQAPPRPGEPLQLAPPRRMQPGAAESYEPGGVNYRPPAAVPEAPLGLPAPETRLGLPAPSPENRAAGTGVGPIPGPEPPPIVLPREQLALPAPEVRPGLPAPAERPGLPAPSPENRLPGTGVAPGLPAEPPPIAGVAPDVAAALRPAETLRALPAPSTENRPPVIEVPPEPGQVRRPEPGGPPIYDVVRPLGREAPAVEAIPAAPAAAPEAPLSGRLEAVRPGLPAVEPTPAAPRTVGEALAEAKKAGRVETPKAAVERVKKAAAAASEAAPADTMTAEVPKAPARRRAPAPEPRPEPETIGDRAGVPREQQSQSERLTAATTKREEIGRALVSDLLAERIPIERAVQHYGSQPSGAGRRRTNNDLYDHVESRVTQTEAEITAGETQLSRLEAMRTGEKSVATQARIAAKIDEVTNKTQTAKGLLPRLRAILAELKAMLRDLAGDVSGSLNLTRASRERARAERLAARAVREQPAPTERLAAREGAIGETLAQARATGRAERQTASGRQTVDVRSPGRVVADLVSGDRTNLTDKLVGALSKGRLPHPAAEKVLEVSHTDQIVKWFRDTFPELKGIRDAREKITQAADNVVRKYTTKSDNPSEGVPHTVHDLAARLAGDDVLARVIDDVGRYRGGVAARLTGDDFFAANAHLGSEYMAPRGAVRENLSPEQQRTLDLKDRWDALTPERQQKYKDLLGHYERMNADERQAYLVNSVGRGLLDYTPGEITLFERQLRTKAGIEQMINNPDATPLAQALGDRFQPDRKLIQEIARGWRYGHIEGDFFPRRRYGNWILEYGDKGTDSYGVEMFERYNQAQARRKELMALGETDVFDVRQKAAFNRRDVIPEGALDRLNQTLQERAFEQRAALEARRPNMTQEQIAAAERRIMTSEQMAAVRDDFAGLILRGATQSQRARTMPQRQGIAGASRDAVRTLYLDTAASASRIGHLLHGPQEQAAIRTAEIAARQMVHGSPGFSGSPTDVIRAQQALAELKARGAPLDGDNSAGLTGAGRAFTRLSAVYQLIRPAHLILQTVDTNAKAAAWLGGRYGFGQGSAALSRALLDVAPAAWRSGFGNMAKAMHGELRAADWDMVKVMENRLISRGMNPDQARELMAAFDQAGFGTHTMASELRRMSQPGGFEVPVPGMSQAAKIGSNMMDLFAVGEHALDVMSRTALAKASFDLAMRRHGGDVGTSVREAIDMVRDVTPSYANQSVPRFATARGSLGQLGATVSQYKIYGMSMYATMANLVRTAVHNPGERAMALKTLAGLYGIHSVLIGATANVFGATLSGALGMWDFVSGRDRPHDYEKDFDRWLTSVAGGSISQFVQKGALGIANIDARRNMGLGNMAGVPQMASFDQAGWAKFMAGAAFGASGGFSQQLLEGVHDIATGNFQRGVTGLLPRILRDPIRAYTMATEGLSDRRGRQILPPEQISPGAVALTAVGFNPNEISTFRDRRYSITERRHEMQYARQQAVDAFVQSRGRDLSAVRTYNDSDFARASPIKYDQLMDALNRERKQLTTYGLTIPKKQRSYLLPAAEF